MSSLDSGLLTALKMVVTYGYLRHVDQMESENDLLKAAAECESHAAVARTDQVIPVAFLRATAIIMMFWMFLCQWSQSSLGHCYFGMAIQNWEYQLV